VRWPHAGAPAAVVRAATPARLPLRRVLVDLTPLEPGGENGGARLVALSLVQEIGRLAPHIQQVVLTNARAHAELAWLDASNVSRQCVVGAQADPAGRRHWLRTWVRAGLDLALPSAARVRLKDAFWRAVKGRQRTRTTNALRPDLVFCPFTAPHYWTADIPLVSVIYDLQYLAYPQFFGPDQRRYRHQHVVDACRQSARVVCISETVRASLLANVQVPAERVTTIHLAPLQPLVDLPIPDGNRLLDSLGLRAERFLLFPANFWAHKNHAALIEAIRLFRARQPGSDLRVVCTGTPNPLMHDLASSAERAAPGVFVFPGFLAAAELVTLLKRCKALVFPSLFEGFGMPVLEAMSVGKPVLCSNSTSLPEVAGDAAYLFDPSNTDAIANAIEWLESRPAEVAALAARGPRRAAAFGTARDMAAAYLEVFEAAVGVGSGQPG
jgi:glycosyltransferase involved in cell wall biosynthesis